METQTIITDQALGAREPLLENAVFVANRILTTVMKYRRMSPTDGACATSPCRQCLSPHLAKIVCAILSHQPVTFVLPAFPGKSPNLAKVLGALPDMAEQCALKFLGALTDQIREIYPPGAEIILCSDGRVFSDSVGMRDEDISAYQEELSVMTHELSLENISMFNLDELHSGTSFHQMRENLMEKYGDSVEEVQNKVRLGKDESAPPENRELHRLYCGITRFLVEDAMHPGQQKSRSAIQKECRIRAYEVIRKSNAWSRLIENHFPSAVRLSIHPQGCGSQKLGLNLMGADGWMTPWHGVAVKKGNQFVLLKRHEAEKLGAELIFQKGRPSHYRLKDEQSASEEVRV